MVAYADTIVDPWAVVVESLYAVVAYLAVPAPAGADSVAVGAQLGAVDCFQVVLKVDSLVLQVAWLRERSKQEERKTNKCNSDVGIDPRIHDSCNKLF